MTQAEAHGTHLYLIRHGQAANNVQPIIAGPKGNTPLTDLGRRQAEALRERLAGGEIRADLLISSSLRRAVETAAIIAPALGLQVQSDHRLHEIDAGEGDGMLQADLYARYGTPDFELDALRPIAEGAESWASFMLRVGREISRVAAESVGKTVVIVTHGGFIEGTFSYFFKLNPLELPPVSFYVQNTSLTHWHHTAATHWHTWTRHSRPRWQLVSYNDAAHLSQVR